MGYYCSHPGLSVAESCLPGFYNSLTGKQTCFPCSIGTICPSSRSTIQTICPAGKVCSIEGRPNPNIVCPSGTYCLTGTSTITPGLSRGPTLCSGGSYCLEGTESGIILDGDARYPQTCIQGTYCPIGTKNPAAIPCPSGFYCPAGSITPSPTEPGNYAKDTGNTRPMKCSPGTFTNISQTTQCFTCPAGYFCSDEGTIEPRICNTGTYREQDPTQIYCSLCPQGTWSNLEGLKSQIECEICPAGIVCLQQGMTSLDQATECPEGYMCKEGTTTYSLKNSVCPAGFYCAVSSSKTEDLEICTPGYYCPQGTGTGSSTQYVCLAGFYCPPATNATLDSEGNFAYISQVDYDYVIAAKIEANQNCTISNCTQDCELSDYIPGCKTYEIPIFETCQEDSRLPPEILSNYTSQKCPEGTTSEVGAKCLGQCLFIGSNYVVEFINPINKIENTTRSLSDISEFYIKPMNLLLLDFDFEDVDPRFLYGSHFTISLKDSNNNPLEMPDYFKSTTAGFHKKFTISILNYSPNIESVTVSISLHNALFKPIAYQLENTLNILQYEPSRAQVGSDKSFSAIIYVNDFTSVEMPYNLIKIANDDGSTRTPWLIDVETNSE